MPLNLGIAALAVGGVIIVGAGIAVAIGLNWLLFGDVDYHGGGKMKRLSNLNPVYGL